MSDIKRSKIKNSIQNKGFVFSSKSGRTGKDRYFLFYNGKWYKNIQVKLSRGAKHETYHKNLWKRMKDSLALDEVDQVRDLLECPMNRDEYFNLLRSKNMIP